MAGYRKGRKYAETWMKKAEQRSVSRIDTVNCYVEALKRDPEYLEAWVGLIPAISKTHDDDDAALSNIEMFKEISMVKDRLPLRYRLIGFCGDNAISLNPKSIDAWNAQGRAYNRWTNSEDDTIKCFERVIELDPDDATAWYFLGKAKAKRGDPYDDNDIDDPEKKYPRTAIKCFDNAIALSQQGDFLEPGDKGWGQDGRANAFIGKGDIIFKTRSLPVHKKSEKENMNDALKCYDKALEFIQKAGGMSHHREREVGDVLHKKGLVFEQQSEYDTALECFEKCGKISYGRNSRNAFHLASVREKINPKQLGSPQSFNAFQQYFEELFGGKLSSADKDERIAGRETSGTKEERNDLTKRLIQNIAVQTGHANPYGMISHLSKIKSSLDEIILETYDIEVEESISRFDYSDAIFTNNEKANNAFSDETSLGIDDAIECYKKSLELRDKATSNPYFICHLNEKCSARHKEIFGKPPSSNEKTCDVCGSKLAGPHVDLRYGYVAEAYHGMALLHKKRAGWDQVQLKQCGLTAESENSKAMECIEHAIHLEEMYDAQFDELEMYWETKCNWLSDDEEVIKFLDEQLDGKYTKESHEYVYHDHTHALLERKISILKKLGRDDECRKAEEMQKKALDDYEAEQKAEEEEDEED